MSTHVAILDYGMGNVNSIKKKLARFKISCIVSSNAEQIQKADKIILPGVGHFGKAMEILKQTRLDEVLNQEVLIKKKPILGICLGMQLMAKRSEEGNGDGLGWIDAEVVKFKVKDTLKYKIPQIGWNQIKITKESLLMKNIPDLSEFYFLHSYHLNTMNKNYILNETQYEYNYASAIEKDNIFGVQYHPEKSHDIGDILLKNFVNL